MVTFMLIIFAICGKVPRAKCDHVWILPEQFREFVELGYEMLLACLWLNMHTHTPAHTYTRKKAKKRSKKVDVGDSTKK